MQHWDLHLPESFPEPFSLDSSVSISRPSRSTATVYGRYSSDMEWLQTFNLERAIFFPQENRIQLNIFTVSPCDPEPRFYDSLNCVPREVNRILPALEQCWTICSEGLMNMADPNRVIFCNVESQSFCVTDLATHLFQISIPVNVGNTIDSNRHTISLWTHDFTRASASKTDDVFWNINQNGCCQCHYFLGECSITCAIHPYGWDFDTLGVCKDKEAKHPSNISNRDDQV